MKVIIYDGFWTRITARQYHDYIFIFGDNDIQQGLGGQAVIRGELNAFGIPTKKLPAKKEEAFYNDDEYDINVQKIDAAIAIIVARLKTGRYKGLIYPKDGLGTGLAQLNIKAPLTFKYLNKVITKLFKFVESFTK